MPLAYLPRTVSLGLEGGGQRELVVRQAAAVGRAAHPGRAGPRRDHSVAYGEPARHERSAARRAEALPAVPLREAQPLLRHGVDRAALLRRVAVAGEVAPPEVILREQVRVQPAAAA